MSDSAEETNTFRTHAMQLALHADLAVKQGRSLNEEGGIPPGFPRYYVVPDEGLEEAIRDLTAAQGTITAAVALAELELRRRRERR